MNETTIPPSGSNNELVGSEIVNYHTLSTQVLLIIFLMKRRQLSQRGDFLFFFSVLLRSKEDLVGAKPVTSADGDVLLDELPKFVDGVDL